LTDVDGEVRAAAVRLAVQLDSRAVELLRIALVDPLPRVRGELARAVSKLDRDSACALLADPNADVRTRALWALVDNPRPDLTGAVADRLGDSSWEARRAACRALGALGSREAASMLVASLLDAHQTVRAAARRALAEIFAGELPELLRSELASPDPALRRVLVYVLAELDAGELTPCLERLAGDPDAGVRMAVATVLRTVSGPDASIALAHLRADPDPGVRLAADSAVETLRRSS